MAPSQNWILGSEHELSTSKHRLSTSKHRLSTSEHEQARANFGIFQFWAVRARYHRFCEEFMKGNDTFQKLDFRIPKIPELQIFRFWQFRARYHRFCEEFIKGNDTLHKLDFGGQARCLGTARTYSRPESDFLPSDSLFLAATV